MYMCPYTWRNLRLHLHFLQFFFFFFLFFLQDRVLYFSACSPVDVNVQLTRFEGRPGGLKVFLAIFASRLSILFAWSLHAPDSGPSYAILNLTDAVLRIPSGISQCILKSLLFLTLDDFC